MLKTRINPTDIDMQQALKRIELQVGPGHARRPDRAGSVPAGGPERHGLGGRR